MKLGSNGYPTKPIYNPYHPNLPQPNYGGAGGQGTGPTDIANPNGGDSVYIDESQQGQLAPIDQQITATSSGDPNVSYGEVAIDTHPDTTATKAQHEGRAPKGKHSGWDPNGRPVYDPLTHYMVDPTNVNTGANFDKAVGDTDKLHDYAWSTDNSPWAKALLDRQRTDEGFYKDDAVRDSLRATAGAQSNLMRTGGMSSGARERLAGGGAENQVMALQSVARGGMDARSDIGINDENRKIDTAQRLPGMYQGLDEYKTGLDKYNTTNDMAVDQWNKGHDYDEQHIKHGSDLEGWMFGGQMEAANQMSNAIGGGGGGGGYNPYGAVGFLEHLPENIMNGLGGIGSY